MQESIRKKRLAKKRWDIQRDEESKQEYKEMRRESKKEVAKAKSKEYDELYEELDTYLTLPKCRLLYEVDYESMPSFPIFRCSL